MKTVRQDEILRCLGEVGVLTVEDAAARLGASPATLRRDFNELADAELVRRERGGIRLAAHAGNLPFAVREVRQAGPKQAIAQRAAAMLRPGDVVFVDGGTTTLQLASCMPPTPLRIITNSLSLAAALERRAPHRSRWEIFLTGGFLFPGSGLLVGPSAQAGLAQYHANWAMLSAGGVTTEGFFNDNEHVVESERVMIAHADRVAVLADHTKIGRHAMRHIAGLAEIDVLITNRTAESREALETFAAQGVEIALRLVPSLTFQRANFQPQEIQARVQQMIA